MRYFKVTDSEMRSLYYYAFYGKGVQYKIGECVLPQVGELFCYSLEHLDTTGFQEYSSYRGYRSPEIRLFECECIEPREANIFCKYLTYLDESNVGVIYNKYYEYTMRRKVVLTKGITLIKEISDNDFRSLIVAKFEESH